MRGTTIGRRIYNPNNFITSKHTPTFLSSSPFSTSSSGGRGVGGGIGGSFSNGQFESSAAAPGKADSDESKSEPPESRPSGYGRGKPIGVDPVPHVVSSFISSVTNSPPGAGRGRVTTESGPSRQTESLTEPAPPKKAEANLPSSILSCIGGLGRGKSVKQEVPAEPVVEENRHIRDRRQPQTRPKPSHAGDGAGPSKPKMSSSDAVKKALDLLSSRDGGGEVEGGGGRGRFEAGRGGGRGGGRDRGRGRRWDRGGGRRRRDDEGYDDGQQYGSEMFLGDHTEDEEKFAQSVGVETMKTLTEAIDEVSGRVMNPMQDEYLDALDTNCQIEFEPEYLMGEFDKNPDIDEKPPMPLRDVLEKVKPFMMPYVGIKSHEEWEAIVEETMKNAPLMKKIVDSYSGPNRVTAKTQQEELERVAKTIPSSAPDSVKSFADRAVLSLKSNPGWGYDKKCQFMDKLAWEASQHYQ